jgi:hypothetical protein
MFSGVSPRCIAGLFRSLLRDTQYTTFTNQVKDDANQPVSRVHQHFASLKRDYFYFS